jgi:hypothetical protein
MRWLPVACTVTACGCTAGVGVALEAVALELEFLMTHVFVSPGMTVTTPPEQSPANPSL